MSKGIRGAGQFGLTGCPFILLVSCPLILLGDIRGDVPKVSGISQYLSFVSIRRMYVHLRSATDSHNHMFVLCGIRRISPLRFAIL
jgi:hypothetical protein